MISTQTKRRRAQREQRARELLHEALAVATLHGWSEREPITDWLDRVLPSADRPTLGMQKAWGVRGPAGTLLHAVMCAACVHGWRGDEPLPEWLAVQLKRLWS